MSIINNRINPSNRSTNEVNFVSKLFNKAESRTELTGKKQTELLSAYNNLIGKTSSVTSAITDKVPVLTKTELNSVMSDVLDIDATSDLNNKLQKTVASLSSGDLSNITSAGADLFNIPGDTPMCQLLSVLNGDYGIELPRLGLILSGLISLSFEKCTTGVYEELIDKIDDRKLKRQVTGSLVSTGVDKKNDRMLITIGNHSSAKDISDTRPDIVKKITEIVKPNNNWSEIKSGLSNMDRSFRRHEGNRYSSKTSTNAVLSDLIKQDIPIPPPPSVVVTPITTDQLELVKQITT